VSDTNPNAEQSPDLLNQVAKALGIDAATATPETVLTTLGTRLGDAAKITTERDAAVAEVTKIKADANAARVESEITASLGRSGIIPHNSADAATILRGVLEVTDKGVVTKAAPNVVPGQTPEQFIASQLRGMRPHYWPASQGGGAKGAGHAAHASGPDASCFKTGNVTAMMNYIGTHGEQAAIAACRRAGIVPPSWLVKGGGR
jgi:hypothetical protein